MGGGVLFLQKMVSEYVTLLKNSFSFHLKMQQLTPASLSLITAAAAHYLICMFYLLKRKPELKIRLSKLAF